MEHLSDDHEDHPNQHENSHKLCNGTGHPVFSLLETQWKLRQQHDRNFPMEMFGAKIFTTKSCALGPSFIEVCSVIWSIRAVG